MSEQQTAIRRMRKLLEANTTYGRRRISQVFRDFCELSAIAIRNSVDRRDWETREQRYLHVIGPYSPEEADRFAAVLAELTTELEREHSDVLGHLYMSLELGSDEMGQFFTPYQVSRLVSEMTWNAAAGQLREKDFITVSEPTCGSGGMIVALAETMKKAGHNYQQQLHVTAQDIELTSVHMTFIALSLLHIPAVIIHGDTLLAEQRSTWPTPAHVLGGWATKLTGPAERETAPESANPDEDDSSQELAKRLVS